MKYAIITIFGPMGRTYTFRNVEVLCDNESVIQFGYSAMSDGKQKVATFSKHVILGVALTKIEEE